MSFQDDDDVGAMWKEYDAQRQKKRGDNRENSAKLLQEQRITFTAHNAGAHLKLVTKTGYHIDFWPGTGLWKVPAIKRTGRGVRALIRFYKAA